MTSTESTQNEPAQSEPSDGGTVIGENQYTRVRRTARRSGESSRKSRRSSRKSSRSSRKSRNESPATKTPIFRQALLTAVFLFGLYLIYGFVSNYISLSEESKVEAKLKREELEASWDIIYVPSRHIYSDCKDWSAYHAKRKQLTLQDAIRHFKEMCTNQGHY